VEERGEGEDEGVDGLNAANTDWIMGRHVGPVMARLVGPTVCTFYTGPMMAAIIGPISYAWLAVRWPNESGQLG